MSTHDLLAREQALKKQIEAAAGRQDWREAVILAGRLLAVYDELEGDVLQDPKSRARWRSFREQWRGFKAEFQKRAPADPPAAASVPVSAPTLDTGARARRAAAVLGLPVRPSAGSAARPGPAASAPAARTAGPSAAAVEGKGSGDGPWVVQERPDVKFADIIGLEDLKKRIGRFLAKLKNPAEVAKWKRARKGDRLILFGPPGTGKTMFAKAMASEIAAAFFEVKASNLLSKWVGESQQNVAALFEAMGRYDKAVVFLDEMEGLLGKRGSSSSVRDGVVSEFLQAMEGLRSRDNAYLFVGATNMPFALDEAIISRFGAVIYVPLPDLPARLALLRREFAALPYGHDPAVSLEDLAARFEGHSMRAIATFSAVLNDIGIEKSVAAGNAPYRIGAADVEEAWKELPPPLPASELVRYERLARSL